MDANGTRIAHLSDVHMLDSRPGGSRSGWSMRHHFLSFGRPLDDVGRRRKFAHALSAARRAGAGHVVVSGDLTEVGAPGEFEALAEVLHESEFAPERITLVPGNHDPTRRRTGGGGRSKGRFPRLRRRAPESPGSSSSARECAYCRST